MPWFRPLFLIKIVSAVFEIFQKKRRKKTLFSCPITILDLTLYGKVKKLYKIEVVLGDKLISELNGF